MRTEIKITDRQRGLAKLVTAQAAVGRISGRAELMRKVGYGWATIDRKSAQVFRSPGFLAALGEHGCTSEKVAKVFADALEATQCLKSPAGEQILVPDHEIRLRTVRILLGTVL